MLARRKNKIHGQYKKGLSLVETLIAIAILLIAIAGPMTIASRSLQTSIFSQEQTAAFYLAQEGIELVIAFRDDEALEELDAGTTDPAAFWDWRPNNCGGASGPAAACGLDPQGAVRDCSTAGRCTLRRDTSVSPEFRHAGSAPFTPYTREITIELSGTDSAQIVSEVTWESALFGITRTVRAETHIYNTYGNF